MTRLSATVPTVALLALAFTPVQQPPAQADDKADRARREVAAGHYVPLETIVEDAQSRYPGRVVEVELDDDEYEIEILASDGAKIELEYDARTGTLLEVDLQR